MMLPSPAGWANDPAASVTTSPTFKPCVAGWYSDDMA